MFTIYSEILLRINPLFTWISSSPSDTGARGSAVVEALRYKSEGRGIDPDGVIGIFIDIRLIL
jgi:hypothetical protein